MPRDRSPLLKLRAGSLALLTLFLCAPSAGASEGPQPGAAFGLLKLGKVALEAGRYEDAIPALSRAADELPLLPDYALFFLSEAYHRSGRHRESLEAVRALLTRYPQTPLRRKAQGLELREAAENEPAAVAGLYETYLKAYPEDEDVMFSFARHLKDTGQSVRAKTLFRQLYVRAGSRAAEAKQELGAHDISSSDVIERATSLFRKYDFDDAEKELKALLLNKGADHRLEAQKHLATALFKQKKYREAAELYGRVDDLYSNTRSLYRAGDKEKFNAALQSLVRRGDQRTGYILNAVAADKRRERDFEAAIRIYRDVQKTYPPEHEEASWGLGWTLFIAGRYEEARTAFSLLHEKYNDPKYLYWQARCLEAIHGNPGPLYARLMKMENNFYGLLAFSRTKTRAARPASLTQPLRAQPVASGRDERIDALVALDMRNEAVAELANAVRNIGTSGETEYLLTKFFELGEYRRAIGLATKLPYSEATHPYWYPLAFWEIVEPVSRKYQVEPFIALSVMREESRFDPVVKSPAGAYGLMQLMPQTAYRLDRNLKMGIARPSQLTIPRNNISLGVYYLSLLLDEFNHSLPHALAAYNAGEIAVRNWVQRCGDRAVDEFIEDIPYPETRNYVKKVLTSYFQYRRSMREDPAEETFDILAGVRPSLDIP